MTRRYILPLAVALGLAPISGAAQSDPTDEFILAEMERQNIPALSLAVLRNGEIVKARGYGLANIAERIPATPRTVYKIASVSKQFIAAGIMRLAQDGRIGLADSVREYLDDVPESWNGITIRHLLTHTSGLARNPPGFDPFKVEPDAEMIATAYDLPLSFAPGEEAEYSNLGYFVLAEVITRVAGRPWTEYLNETIFKPLGMDATHPTNTTIAVAERALGYADNNELREAPEWLALRPSGAFLSTVLDLAKWNAALYTDRILTDASRREMWTPMTLADGSAAQYGLGWMVTDFAERDPPRRFKLVYHTGGMPGARSAFARLVDEGLTIIILMNLDDVDIGAIMFGLVRLYTPVTHDT
ncbi:MAG: serine hydrolase domain-containing protein [Longimicrobiales bacterium]